MPIRTSYHVSKIGDLGPRASLHCDVHGIETFYFEKAGNRYRCRQCNNDAILRRKLALKAELVDLLGGRCSRCGYDKCVNALEFHHRDPTQKLFNVSRMTSHSRAKVLAEAEKCELVCANCHAEIETELRLDP